MSSNHKMWCPQNKIISQYMKCNRCITETKTDHTYYKLKPIHLINWPSYGMKQMYYMNCNKYIKILNVTLVNITSTFSINKCQSISLIVIWTCVNGTCSFHQCLMKVMGNIDATEDYTMRVPHDRGSSSGSYTEIG